MFNASQRRDVLTVSQLTGLARGLLEDAFASPWIVGEVSNYRPAPSGHWYFTLKDSQAELKVAMFRQRNRYCAVAPENGVKLRVRGRLTVYEQRGELQLVAEQLEALGAGALLQNLELLKAKLASEGLFALERKRALPRMPRRLAILTSPTGAAIRDVLSVIKRRFPLMHVELWPVLVQGFEAPGQIVGALAQIAECAERYDLLLLTRGGGSQEDLACFNDEQVVRAVAAMRIPVVSAVGHESDFTLTDLAADLRAATPSAAAELITPDHFELRSRLLNVKKRLAQAIRRRLEPAHQQLDQRSRLLEAHSPQRRLQVTQQRLAQACMRLQSQLRFSVRSRQQQMLAVQSRWQRQALSSVLAARKVSLKRLLDQLLELSQKQLDRLCARSAANLSALNALSPQRTLERGYAIVFQPDGAILKSVINARAAQLLRIQLADGSLSAQLLQRDETLQP